MTKAKKRTARVIGPILHQGHDGLLWKVRLKVPGFPFYLDTELCFTTRERAEAEAEKWRKRKVTLSVELPTAKK